MVFPGSYIWIEKIFIFLFLLYLSAAALLYFRQRSMIFINTHSRKDSAEGFYISGENGKNLRIECANSGKKDALIFFPGNAEDYWEQSGETAAYFPDYTVYLPHYRGYGMSGGEPSEKAIVSDAIRLYDHISKYHKTVSLFGRSLGAAVALGLAAKRKVEKIVLITPFDSIVSLAGDRYPLFPVSIMVRDPFDGTLCAPDIDAEVLVVLAENDELVPGKNSERLIASFTSVKPRVVVLPDTDHETVTAHPEYWAIAQKFLCK